MQSKAPPTSHEPLSGLDGVGLGLRWDFLDEVLECPADGLGHVRFFEVSPENYMRRGGYFPAALDRVRERLPILTHGLTLSIGSTDPLDASYLGELRAFLDRVDPPFHSDHLCFCGVGGRMVHDLLPLPLSRAAARHVGARLREVADRLERPIALENITHYLVPGEPTMDEADFVAEVLDRGDARLLLDVNNVHVNAANHGFDALAFLARLPLDRVVQIHVAGHERAVDDDVVLDTHGAPTAAGVLELLSWVIERTGPLPVLLERDSKVPPLAELIAEVALVDAAYRRGLACRAVREATT